MSRAFSAGNGPSPLSSSTRNVLKEIEIISACRRVVERGDNPRNPRHHARFRAHNVGITNPHLPSAPCDAVDTPVPIHAHPSLHPQAIPGPPRRIPRVFPSPATLSTTPLHLSTIHMEPCDRWTRYVPPKHAPCRAVRVCDTIWRNRAVQSPPVDNSWITRDQRRRD